MMSSLPPRLFLTGTDTNVGKTYVACLLVRALRAAGRDAVGMKALSCGDRGDAKALHAACDGAVPIDELNPVWFDTPVAPVVAARLEARTVDLERVFQAFEKLRTEHECLIVEGLGGWRVPIDGSFCVSDLAAKFDLPVVVVVANRLGAINHTLLTVESIRARGLMCAGLILNRPAGSENDTASATNRGVLEKHAGVPILGEIEYGQTVLRL
jgi:dethiobiotin synthetase